MASWPLQSVHYRQHADVLGYLVCSKLVFFVGHCPVTTVLQSLILLHSSTTLSSCPLTFQECSFRMCSLSQKSGFLFVMFSDPSHWDFSCGSWSLKDVWEFNPFYLDAVYVVSLSNFIRCLPASICLCRLQKIGMLLWIPLQVRSNTFL